MIKVHGKAMLLSAEVNAGGQTTTVVVDQRINGGSYQRLGAFSLTAGDTLSLSNDADGYVIADGILVLPPNAAPSTATWTLTAAETGEYQLAANWTAHSNRASNATYTITTAVGSQTVVMDQRQSGGNWNVLGTVNLAAGESATVSLTDVADGYVIADAIQMISTAAPPNQVVWHPGLSNVGEYEVYTRWSAHPNRASDATYRIQHEGGESAVTVNQQASGGSWNYLGNFELGPDSQILLSDDANGFVVADAIQLSWAGGVVPGEETQTLYYVHTDHLGTPQVITDMNQVTRWRAVYAPFGEVELVVEDIEMPVRFPGQYFDGETGLHYNYFRDYDPSLGRYVQSDPIGLDGGLNTYLYASANPLKFSDPSGQVPIIGFAMVGGLVGGVNSTLGALSQCASAEDVVIAAFMGVFTGAAVGAFTPLLPVGTTASLLFGGSISVLSNIVGQTATIEANGGSSSDFSPASAITSMLGGGIGGAISNAAKVPILAGMAATATGTGVVDSARNLIAEKLLGSGACSCSN